eukprot:TRINITY_DN138_c0_g1_i2.p1 TRINITY_DN138_c0_g1~~TRINITY_DN138_c0_g1_i2.p1  ORF type:complete len:254 (+),score=56.31 TRINITY_DN138_c0_g1_i2:936-1697(+)
MVQNSVELWLFAATGPNIYYNLSFLEKGDINGENPILLYQLVQDGRILQELVSHNFYLLGPGSRVGFLVVGPPKGSYTVTTMPYSTGPGGDSYPRVDLAEVISTSSDLPIPSLPTTGFSVLKDYRKSKISRKRVIVFSEIPGTEIFFIDGKRFDKNRDDFIVQLGSIEEWVLINLSPEEHWFHIHQIDFQVSEINGDGVPFFGYQDTCRIPRLGSTTLLLPFDNPVIVGKFVFHCHILGHEDGGMMATVIVKP